MNTWLRRMRRITAAQRILTGLRVLATAQMCLTVLRTIGLFRKKQRKGI